MALVEIPTLFFLAIYLYQPASMLASTVTVQIGRPLSMEVNSFQYTVERLVYASVVSNPFVPHN